MTINGETTTKHLEREPAAKYRYFAVYELPRAKRRKTSDFVLLDHYGGKLGLIFYCNRWRQHVLRPSVGTIWSTGCLEDVRDFIASIKR